jgi:outer membrane protein assembly factor BamD
MNIKFLLFLGISFLFLLSSCKFQKVLKKGTVDEKYDMAIARYEAKDYARALQLFDQLSGAMRATEKAQKMAYMYAYCYYNQNDYTLGSYYFKRYSTSYPNSPEAEECLFMSAYCNYLNSPEYSLDQSTTYEALKDLQLFTNTYPKSNRVSECNDLMDQLRYKLELKDYRIAKMYYRMEDYAAANQSFNNIMKDFPDSPHKEEIMFLLVKSSFHFARESILEKQKERQIKVLAAYNEFASVYPQSKFLPEATIMSEKIKMDMEAIKNGTFQPSKQNLRLQLN